MIIYVKVKPRSKKDFLEKTSECEYLVYTKEKAIDGKANLAVIKMLVKEFNISPNHFIIKTPKSRKKIIEIVK